MIDFWIFVLSVDLTALIMSLVIFLGERMPLDAEGQRLMRQQELLEAMMKRDGYIK